MVLNDIQSHTKFKEVQEIVQLCRIEIRLKDMKRIHKKISKLWEENSYLDLYFNGCLNQFSP